MAGYTDAFTDPDFWSSPSIPSKNLPLNLDNLGIGTKNAPGTFLDTIDPRKLFGLGTGTGSPATNASNLFSILGGGDTSTATGATASGSVPSGGGGSIPGLGNLGEWVARGAIIILGFIFVAVGLSMFKPSVVAAIK